MLKLECGDEWLVAYADGELSDAQLVAAEQHLSACQQCPKDLAALRRSLSLVRRQWALPIGETDNTPAPAWSTSLLLRAAVVAAVALTLGWQLVPGKWRTTQSPPSVAAVSPERETSDPINTITVPPARAIEPASPPGENITENIADINSWLRQQTQAARLRAASAVLAEEPGMAERSEQLARYASEAYGP